VHSTADYCASVWCRSAHTRLIDPTINDALQTVTWCLRPTPAENLPIFAGIQAAEFCHNGATLFLGRHAMEPGHLLHSSLTCPPSADAQCLKSRLSFVTAAQHLISSTDNQNMRVVYWTDYQWNSGWADKPSRIRIFIPDAGHPPPGDSPKSAWVWLIKRHCTGVGRFCSCLYKWGYDLLCGLWVWRRRTKCRPCCPSMSNPSTSAWTVRPDGSGRWHNRIVAQHLPGDLARPSSGLKKKEDKEECIICKHRCVITLFIRLQVKSWNCRNYILIYSIGSIVHSFTHSYANR